MSLLMSFLYGAIVYVAIRVVVGFFGFDPTEIGERLADDARTLERTIQI